MQPLKNDFFIFFDILELSRKNFFLANMGVMGIQAIPALLPTFGPLISQSKQQIWNLTCKNIYPK